MHADRMVGAREYDAFHLVPSRSLVDCVQSDQVVFDDFGQWPLDARARHVDQNVNALQKPVDILAIAQITVRDILVATKRLQRTKPGGAKVDALREQRSAQELPELPVCARQCDPGHGLPAPARPTAAEIFASSDVYRQAFPHSRTVRMFPLAATHLIDLFAERATLLSRAALLRADGYST
jgi:hypothetical protein